MSRFWITYLVTAAFGTAAAYYGAPALSDQLARAQRQPSASGQPAADRQEAPGSVAVGLTPAPVAPPPVHTPSRIAPAAVSPAVPVAAEAGEEAGAETAEAPATDRPLYRPPVANPQADSWAVLRRNAPHYSVTGQNLGTLPAGTIGEISKTTTSSHGDVAVCTVDINGQWKGPVLVGVDSLVIFEGPLTRVPQDTLDLLHRYYTLKGRAEARAEDLRRKQSAANPHAAAYARANESWDALNARVAPLTAEFNRASGARRAELLEQLKRMRIEQSRLRIEREEARAKVNAWNEKNPPRPSDPARDPELAGWLAEIRRIEPDVQRIIPQREAVL